MFNFPFLDWFIDKSFINGDFRFFWPENIGSFANFPLSWDSSLNTGIGTSAFSFIWINTYLNFTAFISNFGLPWSLIGLLFWIIPVFFISFVSSFLLYRYIFQANRKSGVLAGIIYSSNTYILMILSGGQLGVSLAYSLVPLVIYGFIKVINDLNYRSSIIFSLIFSLEILFDPRIAYISCIPILLYFFFKELNSKKLRKKIYFVFIVPVVLTVLMHSYWIFPMIFFRVSSIPEGFNSIEGLKFFSFADFSNSLSLLHPNWPENIFGKTYFMRAEFILLPIIAYSSLLFFRFIALKSAEQYAEKRGILFFALLGLIGAFLAKGTNPPFGDIYVWFFNNLPGFVAFRDPTKWYILVAVSYSILIPFSLSSISQKLHKYLYVLFIVLWAFIILPGIIGQLGKNFKIVTISKEYSALKDFLAKDKNFYRTLWIPTWQRFGYFSNLHPAIRAPELSKDKGSFSIIGELNKPEVKSKIEDFSVKYIVIPHDSEGEIFLRDRKYDEKAYLKTITDIRKIKWLKEIDCLAVKLLNCSGDAFAKIKVFEVHPPAGGPKDHFWSTNESLIKSYKYVNTTKYEIDVQKARKGDIIVFSERFDLNWQAKTKTKLINSKPYAKLLNSFVLEDNGSYTIEVSYRPQKLVNIGMSVSIIATILLIALLIGWKRNSFVQ